MAEQSYRIRIKQGEMEIDVVGDMDFVQTRFDSLSTAMNIVTEKPLETETMPEVKEKKKRGRKPKTVEPSPETKMPKKRGRKPKEALAMVEEVPEVKERKKPGRKPKAPKEEKPDEEPSKKERMDLKDKSLPDLVAMKGAKKDGDRVLLAAYYVNKIQKKREFRSNDIYEVLKADNLPEPSNMNYHLRKLTDDRGLLDQGRKQGRYKISDNGVKWVEYN